MKLKIAIIFTAIVITTISEAYAEQHEIISMGSDNTVVYNDIDICFKKASKHYGIKEDILKAIAKTESNFNIYAINIKGKAYYPKTLDGAKELLTRHKSANPDIGIMQINAKWFQRFNYPLHYGLTPCFNIYFASYILKKKIEKYGDNWYGLASYHSATPRKNVKYAWLVYKNLQEVRNGNNR